MDDDLMNDVMDVLQELCDGLAPFRSVAGTAVASGAIEIIAAHQGRITQLAEDLYDCLYRVREARRTATARSSGSSGMASAALRGPLAFAEPSPMALTLLVRKLGDVLESAHSVRVTIDTHRSELYSPPARSPGALPPLRPSAAMAEYQRGEFLRIEQALAGLDTHLQDAQRLLRIAYPAPFMPTARLPRVESTQHEASPDVETYAADVARSTNGAPLPSQWHSPADTLRVSSSIDSGTQLYEQSSVLLTTTDSTTVMGGGGTGGNSTGRQYQTESVESLPLNDPLSQTERYLSVSTPRASTSTLPYIPYDGSSPPRSLSASVDRARSANASRLSCPQVSAGSALSAALLPNTPRSLLSSPRSGRNTLAMQPPPQQQSTNVGSRGQRDGGEVMEDEIYHGRQSPGRQEEGAMREASPNATAAKTFSDAALALQTVFDACSGSSEEREDLSHSPPPCNVQLTSVANAAAAAAAASLVAGDVATRATTTPLAEQTSHASPLSARGLPPRAPSLPPTAFITPASTTAAAASNSNSNSSNGEETRVTTRHTHCLPGALWADILARQRARLERTLVTDIVDLLNYGQEAPLVTEEDMHELHFSLAGNYLYLFFTLTHPDSLMETEINMRVSLCAFPALNALYDEYAQHAQGIKSSPAKPSPAAAAAAAATSRPQEQAVEQAVGPAPASAAPAARPSAIEDGDEVLMMTQNGQHPVHSPDQHSTPPRTAPATTEEKTAHEQPDEQQVMAGDELFAPVPTVLTPRRTAQAVTTAVAVAAARRSAAKATSPVPGRDATRRTRGPAVAEVARALLSSDTAAVVSASTNSSSSGNNSEASSQSTKQQQQQQQQQQEQEQQSHSSDNSSGSRKERSASRPTAQTECVQHCSYVVAGKAWPQVLASVAPDKLLAAIVADLTTVLQLPVSALQHISIPAPVGEEQRARLTELPIEFDLKLPATLRGEGQDSGECMASSLSASQLRSRLQHFDFPVLHTLYRKTLAECELKSSSAVAVTTATMPRPPDLSAAASASHRTTAARAAEEAAAPAVAEAPEATRSSSDATPSFVTTQTTQLRAEEEDTSATGEHEDYEGHTLHDVLPVVKEDKTATLHRVLARAASSTSSSTTVVTEDTRSARRSAASSPSSSSSSPVFSNGDNTPELDRSPRPDQAPRPWPAVAAGQPPRLGRPKSASAGREGSNGGGAHAPHSVSAANVKAVSRRRRVIAPAQPPAVQVKTSVKKAARSPAATSPPRRSPSPMQPPADLGAHSAVPQTIATSSAPAAVTGGHERQGSSATQESGSRRGSDVLRSPPLQPRSWCPTPHPTRAATTTTTTAAHTAQAGAMPTLSLASVLAGTAGNTSNSSSRAAVYSARGVPKTARMPRPAVAGQSNFRRTASAVAREHVERLVMHGRLSDEMPQRSSPVRQFSEEAAQRRRTAPSAAAVAHQPPVVTASTTAAITSNSSRSSGSLVNAIDRTRAAAIGVGHESLPRMSAGGSVEASSSHAVAESTTQYTSVASKHVDPLLDAVPSKVVRTARVRPTTFTRSVVQNYREQHPGGQGVSETGSQSRDNSLGTVNSVTRHAGLLARPASSRRREPHAVPFSARPASGLRSRVGGGLSGASAMEDDSPASRQMAAIERAFGLVVNGALCVQQAVGLAAEAHVARGDVVRTLNGHALRTRAQLLAGLAAAATTGAPCVFMTLQNTRGALFTRRVHMPAQALPPLQPDVLMTMMHDGGAPHAQEDGRKDEDEGNGLIIVAAATSTSSNNNKSGEDSLAQTLNSGGGGGGLEVKDGLQANGRLGSETSSVLDGAMAALTTSRKTVAVPGTVVASARRGGGYIAVTSRPVERVAQHVPLHNAAPLVSRSARPCSTASPVPRRR